MNATFANAGVGCQAWPTVATNKKTPTRGERGALGRSFNAGLRVAGELPPISLLEPRLVAFDGDLSRDRGRGSPPSRMN